MSADPYGRICQNLRLYLSEASLPYMPLDRRCPYVDQDRRVDPDLFLLAPEPDSMRKLKLILHLVPDVLNKKIEHFIEQNIPSERIDAVYGDHAHEGPAHICVPASSFNIFYRPPGRLTGIQTMALWLRMPLLTAGRIMRIVWPEQTRDFCLKSSTPTTVRGSPDESLYRAYYWEQCRNINHNEVDESTCKLVVASVAPWALSPLDMDDFMRINKIWDECTSKRCPYFVLSVYHGWVFGVFLQGWTTALISDVITHTATKPTLMQWLLFWIASAMKIPGCWKPPALKRFCNPDIRDKAGVSEKYSFTGTEDQKSRANIKSNEDWFEEYYGIIFACCVI
ncbi:hypothetical protein K439DRAFT_1618635 [Ramaria rubella]|nr:hypothetical protein K439DRAFT_1618635 [Ramaria rubella]